MPGSGVRVSFQGAGRRLADIVTDEAVWCPFCGHEAKSDEWWTHEQMEKAKEAAFAEVKHTIDKAMRRDADRFNPRQPRRSFISMSMKVDAKPKEIVLPAVATVPMQLKIKCPECACRYAVIGSAYFCPACGHNAADLVFSQSLGTIRATLDNLPIIAAGLPSHDDADNIVRLLTEDSLREGLVDAGYITKTGDHNYREGQRLVVKEAAVRECVALIEKLAQGLAADAL